MIKASKLIIENVLKTIYQPFIYALVLSLFIMFFVMYIEKYKGSNLKDRIKKAAMDWKNKFVESVKFRREFYFIFVAVMILFVTLLNRDLWRNPIDNVLGVWGLYKKDGTFTTEIIENVVLFIPLIFFLFFFLETTSKKASKFLTVMGRAIVISFLLSLAIEMLQLFLRLGTWQLSDLCFNTLGGVIGGLIYWVSARCRGV